MLEVLLKKIKEGRPFKWSDSIKTHAKTCKMYYTGKDDFEELTNYRFLETDNQKKQRNRITIRRPKHVCMQIENTLDLLHTLDKAIVNVSHESETKTEILDKHIYEINVSQQAFDYVKYYNIVDPNTFLICYKDELESICFDAVESENIFDFKIKNDRVEYLIIKMGGDLFRIYTKDFIADYKGIAGKEPSLIDNTYKPTSMCFAYHIGYIKNSETKFQSFKSILDPAFNMLKQLLWDGSEYDVIKATHGIIKQFNYAKKCNYQSATDDGHEYCNEGNLMLGETYKGSCKVCNGSGLKIHTSSQDVIYLREPEPGQEQTKLADLIHTVFIPDSILQNRKVDLMEIEDKIQRTVFNSNQVTREELVKTATQVNQENKGVVSALQKMGNKVTETFIWMVECIASIEGIENASIFHGYSMDLSIETLDSLFAERERAIKAGVGSEVVDTIDRSILKKQHLDTPEYLARVELWETFKPFRDKTPSEKLGIVAMLPDDNRFKILYVYWNEIKNNVLFANENFYELEREKQKELINAEIDKLIELNKVEVVPEMSFNEFG